MKLPVGSTFEQIVNWLKSTFGPFFDALSSFLDSAISLLESALLLDGTAGYPSVFLALFVGIIVYFLVRRVAPKAALIAAVVAVAATGAVEVWRSGQLNQMFSPEDAATMAAQVDALSAELEAIAPDDYSEGIAALDAISPGAWVNADFERRVANARSELDDMRPNRFDDAAEEISGVLEDMLAAGAPSTEVAKIQKSYDFYYAFRAIEEGERLARSLRRVDEPERLIEALNERTYSRNMEIYAIGETVFAEQGASPAVIEQLSVMRETLAKLNPARLSWYPWVALSLCLIGLGYILSGTGLAIFALIGLPLIVSMGFWESTMETLALVLSATLFALCIGVPIGVLSAQSKSVDQIMRPILDFMQTMPAFVYLIPAVLFFGLGKVPGAMATLIFAMPPAVRLTALGIRQVPEEVVEAAQAFGATTSQMLFKAQLPIALPTILAGVNQTIMLALSMVVIGGMIGAGGLGEDVLSGITQLKIGLGFESGIAVVILAIFLDRLTQALGGPKRA